MVLEQDNGWSFISPGDGNVVARMNEWAFWRPSWYDCSPPRWNLCTVGPFGVVLQCGAGI